jgi:uncharacterized protein YjgD (DUF1641 family)
MANPIAFKPPLVDPRVELNRRLDAAPTEHAEALLVAWDILQSAHDQGLLDAFHGLIAAKDTIFATLAAYAKMPEGAAGVRNFLALTKMFASIDPESLDHIAKSMSSAIEEHQREEKPPSLWQLARRANSEDSRRGFSFMTLLLARFGRALKE